MKKEQRQKRIKTARMFLHRLYPLAAGNPGAPDGLMLLCGGLTTAPPHSSHPAETGNRIVKNPSLLKEINRIALRSAFHGGIRRGSAAGTDETVKQEDDES